MERAEVGVSLQDRIKRYDIHKVTGVIGRAQGIVKFKWAGKIVRKTDSQSDLLHCLSTYCCTHSSLSAIQSNYFKIEYRFNF